MHLRKDDYNQNQIKTAIAVNIQTAIALWESKDWHTYKTTRDSLLTLIRSGRADDVGIDQLQFIYFVNTHLRHRFSTPMSDAVLFANDLPLKYPAGDHSWKVASEGAFWSQPL
jgi:hypothetical protein